MPVRIDSVSDYIALSTSGAPSFTAFTITFWYQIQVSNAGTDRTLFDIEATGTGTSHRLFVATDNINYLVNDSITLQPFSTQPSESQWVMAAMSCAGTGATDLKAYFWNAADPDAAYSSAQMTGNGSTLNQWSIGGNHGFSEFRNARFCFVKVWGAVLSLAELQAERTQGKPVRTSNVNRYHRLLNNTDTSDGSGNGRTVTFNGTVSTEGTEPVPWELSAGAAAAHAYYRSMLVR
jgi:hypothetical protein